MFEFMLMIGAVMAFYGFSVLKSPNAWGNQGKDAIRPENWNAYVVRNGQFFMYAGFLLLALTALDAIFNLPSILYLLILLGGLALLVLPLCRWMHEHEGRWWPWPKKKKS